MLEKISKEKKIITLILGGPTKYYTYSNQNLLNIFSKISKQVLNNNFQVTPNGRISASKPIVIVIGSKYHKTRPKILNCITINIPTGRVKKGKFNTSSWLIDNMPVSQLSTNSILTPERCEL